MSQVHPMEYPINAESLERFLAANPLSRIEHVRWAWEEIAQLNAGIKFLETLLDTKSAELEQWKNEARSATHSIKELRALMPKL